MLFAQLLTADILAKPLLEKQMVGFVHQILISETQHSSVCSPWLHVDCSNLATIYIQKTC